MRIFHNIIAVRRKTGKAPRGDCDRSQGGAKAGIGA
jgi:hypothetical protein